LELAAALAKLAETTERLRELSLRVNLSTEPALLPRWKRTHTVHKTTFMRSNMREKEVLFLRQLLNLPDARTALRQYQETHRRVLQGKRMVADPDPLDTTWRQRPARYLTARQMAEEQLSGRALQRELRRIR
jgi:hypothetical protein